MIIVDSYAFEAVTAAVLSSRAFAVGYGGVTPSERADRRRLAMRIVIPMLKTWNNNIWYRPVSNFSDRLVYL